MKSTIWVLGILVLMTSCIKKSPTDGSVTTPAMRESKSPEEVVKTFVDFSATAKVDADRKRLQDLCAGEMRKAFERMTAEAFRLAYISGNVKLKSIKILETSVEATSAKVRYQVTIDNNQGSDPTQEINEREVELDLAQGVWYIIAIRPKGSDKIAFTRGMIF